MSRSSEGKVYVGNLPPDVKEADVDDLFYKFGKITVINLKTPSGQPPFAFLEFEDPRDAEDAIKDRDGYNYDGYTLRVEHPRGNRTGGRGGGGFGGRGGGYGGRGGDRYGGGRDNYGGGRRDDRGSRGYQGGGGGANRRSDYRVLVSGLPKSGSWQDLKDHMREAGDVCYADVYKDGTGVVEFIYLEGMKYAARKLDYSKFRSHEGETAHIRVKDDYDRKSGTRSSRSRSISSSKNRSRGSPIRRSSPFRR